MSSEMILLFIKALAAIALAAGPMRTSLPITVDTGGVVLEVTVEGRGPFPFALSSSGNLELSGSLLAALGRSGAAGETLVLERIAIGDLILEDIPARPAVERLDRLEAPSGNRLPLGLLDRFLVTVDYASRVLTIEEGELPPADGETIVSFELGPDGAFTVPVQVDGLRVQARLEPGSGANLTMGARYLDKLPLGDREVVGYRDTPEGQPVLTRARFSESVRIGREALSVWTILFDADEPEASLGYAALRDHAITLDQANRLLRIVRTTGPGG